ncbi:MAG: hypothetical protein DRI88_04505 [Bacteroidetes bacterium]|nr:MAG: hypothetical protein DRI88_04505 [Bacteroidota bacterium]RLD85567.1 MAG: hypothetical protein DRJ02_10150 [Bacteroidota bacterium]
MHHKKVLVIAYYMQGSGVGNYLLYLLEYLSKKNARVFLFVVKEHVDRELIQHSIAFNYQLISKDIPCVTKKYLHKPPVNLVLEFFILLPIVIRLNPNLIIISPNTPVHWMGGLLFPKKTIYVVHSFPRQFKKWGISLKQFLRLLPKRNKSLITVSDCAKEFIKQQWLTNKSQGFVKRIYNTPHLRSDEDIKELTTKEESKIKITTLGQIRDYKNTKLWIQVANKVISHTSTKSVEFTWAGPCMDKEYYEECISLIVPEVKEQIKFVGYTNDVCQLLKETDIYFHPSLSENHSISILEAMFYGLPCVVSDAGGNVESVINNNNGFICAADDIDAYVTKLLYLINNKKERTKMGANSKKIVNENFSFEQWQLTMDELLQV